MSEKRVKRELKRDKEQRERVKRERVLAVRIHMQYGLFDKKHSTVQETSVLPESTNMAAEYLKLEK